MGNDFEEDAERFCREVWPDLARTLATYTGDRQLGQDMAQEALATVLARWPRVRRMDSPRGYAVRVGVNLAKDALTKQARDRGRVPTPADEDGRSHGPEDLVADRVAVQAAVGGLPARQRLAVTLRYLADLSVAQTAAIMKCRPGTVRALCHQAGQSLKASPDLDWHSASQAVPFEGNSTRSTEVERNG